MVYRVAYISTSTISPARRENALEQILDSARSANATNGVTGALICKEHAFFQTLEGDRRDSGDTFRRISRYARHRNVVILLEEDAEARVFPDWSMGRKDLPLDHPLADQIHSFETAMDVPGLAGSNLYLQATMFLT